jgi:hypothetical protein
MEYFYNFMFRLIESIKIIFDNNFDILGIIKLIITFYIIYIIIINLQKLYKIFINKKINYDNSLLKIYKLLKNKNFFSKKLVIDILKKNKENIKREEIIEDKNIKLFKFINKKIQLKYKLSNKNSSNVIFYLYNLIKNLD